MSNRMKVVVLVVIGARIDRAVFVCTLARGF